MNGSGRLLAVCVSSGGIPKLPVVAASLDAMGLEGDGRNHAKHWKPHRALSLLDLETMQTLRAEGFDLQPGGTGENLTLEGVNVQVLTPGTRLLFSGGVVLELTEPRKPCYVLDSIDSRLKDVTWGRIGFMASVVKAGTLTTGETVVSDCNNATL